MQIVVIVVIGVITLYLATEITRLTNARTALGRKLSDESAQLETLRRESAELEQQKAVLESQVEGLQDRNVALRADLTTQEATIGILGKLAPAATKQALSVAETTPRVYIQVSTPENEAVANTLRPRLEQAGFLIPRIERVAAVPRRPQVRYFRAEDQASAQRVGALIRSQLPDVEVVSFEDVGRRSRTQLRHLELWF